MSFFEQIGKKLSDAGQGAAAQTRSFAEITRLNSAISDREKKLEALYRAIGEAYYRAHKNDASPECAPEMAAANELSSQIAADRERIKVLRGIVSCPQCGADIPSGAQFCSVCGHKMPLPAPKPDTCVQCGAPLSPGALFCSVCGQRVPVPAPVPNTCPKCGAAVNADMLFCVACGTKLEQPAEVPSPPSAAPEFSNPAEVPAAQPVTAVPEAEEEEFSIL